MKPYISVIVPVYQAEKTLDRCIRSVLEQAYGAYEMILVDDGSGDGSGAVCDQYARKDTRVRVIHQANAGVSAARNAGIGEAQGQYLLFLDSDDALMPGALDRFAEMSENGRYDVVIGRLSVVENGMQLREIGVDSRQSAGREIWEQICRDSAPFGYAGGKLIRREPVQQNGLKFNTAMQSQEDLDFFLSAYSLCETFRIVPECLYCYYYAPPKRNAPVWDFIANQLKLLRLARENYRLSDEAGTCVQKRILSLLFTSLYTAAEQGGFDVTVQKLRGVAGLKEFLENTPAAGEHGFVSKNFVSGNYGRIKRYFLVRNKIRDAARKCKRRKH